jgi:MFS family permease
MRLLRTVLSNGPIARVIAAWAGVSLGWWAFSIVLSLYAYRAGGAGAVALALTVRMLPSALAAPYTSLLGDRHMRRSVLLVTAALSALLLAVVAAAASADAPLAVVLLPAVAFTSVNTAYRPAQAALLAELARSPGELGAGNVCVSTLESGGFLLGSLMAGALAGYAGLDVAFAACAAAYAVALLGLLGVPATRRPAPVAHAEAGAVAELLHGVRTVAAHPDIRLLVQVFGVVALVEGAVDVLLVVAALELLGIGEDGVGWLNACWGIGGVAGGMAALTLVGRGRLALGLLAGLVLAGLPLVVVGAWPHAAAAYPLLVLLGVGYALVEVALLTLTQRLASDDVLARVFGVEETARVIATALGSLAAGALVGVLGARGAIVAVGVVLPVLGVALWRRLAGFAAGAQVPERAFALVRGLSLFAPLPLAIVETLALRLRERSHPAGEPIVRQGEPGDTFYVIADGTVEVQVDGAVRRQEGAGEFFGEIALLRDVPRTATVTALTPVTTLALDREDFLSGVGAHARSASVAEAVVTERLAAPLGGAGR